MGKNLNSKNWKKTSYKRYEAYISMPELGTKVLNKVTGEELVTCKGSNFVVSTLDGNISLESANYIAKHFEFIDGSEIRPDTLKRRAVTINQNLYLDWTRVVSKSKVEPLWAYYCDNKELADSLSNRATVKGNVKQGYFLVCKDSNGEPNTLSYSVESGKDFVYKYDLRAFPGISKSYTDKEMELNKPSSLLDKSIEEKVNAIAVSREMSLKELANIFYSNLQIVKDEYSDKVLDNGAPYISKLGKPSIDEEKRLIVCKNILKVNNLPFDYYSILQVSKTGICSITNTVDYKKVMGDLPKKAVFELEKKSIKEKTEEEISCLLSIDFCDIYADALKRVEFIALETIGPQMKYLTMLVDRLREVNNEANYELYDYHKKLDAKYPYRARLSATLGESKMNLVICMTEELDDDFPIVAVFGEDANNKKIRRLSLTLNESIMSVLSFFRSEEGYESMGHYIVKAVLKSIDEDPKYRKFCFKPNDNTLHIEKCEITENELVLVDYNYNVILIGKEESEGNCRVIFDCNSSKNYIFTSSYDTKNTNNRVKCNFNGLIYKLVGLICGQVNEMTNRTSKLYDLCTEYLKSLDLDFIKNKVPDCVCSSSIEDFDDILDVSSIHSHREYLYGRICKNKIQYDMKLENIGFFMTEYFKIYEVKLNKYEKNEKTTKESVDIEFNLKHEGLLGETSLGYVSLQLVSNEILSKSVLKNKLDDFILECQALVDSYTQELSTNIGCVVGEFSKNSSYTGAESIFVSKYALKCKEYIKVNIKDFAPEELKEASFPIGREDYFGYSTYIEFDTKGYIVKLICAIRCRDKMAFETKLMLNNKEAWINTIELTPNERLNFLNMIYEYRLQYDKYRDSELDNTHLIERFDNAIDELIHQAKLKVEPEEEKTVIEDTKDSIQEKPIRKLNQAGKIRGKSNKEVCEKLIKKGTEQELVPHQTILNLFADNYMKALTEASEIEDGLSIGLRYGKTEFNAYIVEIVYAGRERDEFKYKYIIYDYTTKELLVEKEVYATKKTITSMFDTVFVPGSSNRTNYGVNLKSTATTISNEILRFFKEELKKGYNIKNNLIPESLDNLTEYKLNSGLVLDLTKVYTVFDKWGFFKFNKHKYAEKIILALNLLCQALDETKESSNILALYQDQIEIEDKSIKFSLDYTNRDIDVSDIEDDVYPFPYFEFEISNTVFQICYVIDIETEVHKRVPTTLSEAENQIKEVQELCEEVLKENIKRVEDEETF